MTVSFHLCSVLLIKLTMSFRNNICKSFRRYLYAVSQMKMMEIRSTIFNYIVVRNRLSCNNKLLYRYLVSLKYNNSTILNITI